MSKKPLHSADPRELARRMSYLRQLLGEAGYKIFDVEPSRRRGDLDIIAIHVGWPTNPLWLYPGPAGRIVIRPWEHKRQSKQLRQRMPASDLPGLRLHSSRTMPEGGEWYEWLSPEAQVEARLLRIAA